MAFLLILWLASLRRELRCYYWCFHFFSLWKIDFNVESLLKNQLHKLTQGLTLKIYIILSALEFHKPRIWTHLVQKAYIFSWGKMSTEILCILTKHSNCPYSNTEGAYIQVQKCLCISVCLYVCVHVWNNIYQIPLKLGYGWLLYLFTLWNHFICDISLPITVSWWYWKYLDVHKRRQMIYD